MHTNSHQILRTFGLIKAVSAETRQLHLHKEDAADPSQIPQSRRFELDRRLSTQRQDTQMEFLQEHHIDNHRWDISRLMGIDTGARIAKEAGMQEAERNIDSLTIGQEGRIRSLLMTTNPKGLKDAFSERYNGAKVTMPVRAQRGNGEVSVDMQVDFSRSFWTSSVTEQDVVRILQDGTYYNHFDNGTGITFPLIKGIPLQNRLPWVGPSYTFTEAQAKTVAKMIMGARYSRGIFAMGGVGEVNASLARWLVQKKPYLMKHLEAKNGHHDDEKTLRSKQSLSDLLERLEKIQGENHDANFSTITEQLRVVQYDLDHLRTSPAFQSSIMDTWGVADGPGFIELPADTRKNITKELNDEKGRLQKAAKYYRSLKDLLVAMRNQIGDIHDFTVPAAGVFGGLFNAEGEWAGDGNLDNGTNPVEIARNLRQQYELKKPDEYKEEIAEAKKHGKEHKDENLVGARAVIEIYKKYLMEEEGLDPSGAGNTAFQAYFQNEITEHENRQLEEQIDTILGGEHTIMGGIASGAISTAKSVVQGSDEAFIVKIAESPEVQIPRGEGTAATTLRHKALEATTWTGAAAGTAAGLSAYGVLGSSVTVPSLSLPVASAIGGGVPLLAAAGAGGLGLYGGLKCLQRMHKAKTKLGQLGWGLGGITSVGAGGLSAVALESTAAAGYTGSLAIPSIPAALSVVPSLSTALNAIPGVPTALSFVPGLSSALGAVPSLSTALSFGSSIATNAVAAAGAVPVAMGGLAGFALGAKCFQNMVKSTGPWYKRLPKQLGWGVAGAGSMAAGGLATAAATGLTGLAGASLGTLSIPAWGAAITTGLTGLGASLPAIPMVAAAAGAGLAGWGILKATGLDRRMFGTRVLTFFHPRTGARPAWGKIAHDRRKLKIVWNAMIKGVKEGKLSNTWYVRDQLREIGRLLLSQFAVEMGEDAGEVNWDDQQWEKFTMENTRARMQQHITKMVHEGIAAKDPDVAEASTKTAKYSTEQKAGWRKGIAEWMNTRS